MIDFGHSLMGWDVLFSLTLFGATVLFGWRAIRTSFDRTSHVISARATADLTRAYAELQGLYARLDSLEQQLIRIAERVNRCEQEHQQLAAAIQSRVKGDPA